MAGMADEHRKILQRHRADLVKDLEPLKLLNDLAEFFDEDDREAVKACNARKDMAEELLDMIPRKGPKAFQCFVAALQKRQKHLAKPLIEESGIDVSTLLKDDVGMTSQHRQILISNVENLHEINLAKVVQLLHLSGLLDDTDKQNLLADTKLPSQRVDMLLTEILPRKGPKAFESFAQELEKVDPPLAHRLLQDAGIKGSYGERSMSTPPPIARADMSRQHLYAVKGDKLYKAAPPRTSTDNWLRSAKEIQSAQWDNCSHLFFHPDGTLYSVWSGKFYKGSSPSPDRLIGNGGWNVFKLLFFDPHGVLYGVNDGVLYKRAPPTGVQDVWMASAEHVRAHGWSDYKFLFFDPEGTLYGVENGKFHKYDKWLASFTLIGNAGWSDFDHLFFMADGELYGVHKNKFYRGLPPSHSSEVWLGSSTLIGSAGWSKFKFLISPLRRK